MIVWQIIYKSGNHGGNIFFTNRGFFSASHTEQLKQKPTSNLIVHRRLKSTFIRMPDTVIETVGVWETSRARIQAANQEHLQEQISNWLMIRKKNWMCSIIIFIYRPRFHNFFFFLVSISTILSIISLWLFAIDIGRAFCENTKSYSQWYVNWNKINMWISIRLYDQFQYRLYYIHVCVCVN